MKKLIFLIGCLSAFACSGGEEFTPNESFLDGGVEAQLGESEQALEPVGTCQCYRESYGIADCIEVGLGSTYKSSAYESVWEYGPWYIAQLQQSGPGPIVPYPQLMGVNECAGDHNISAWVGTTTFLNATIRCNFNQRERRRCAFPW